MKREFVVNLNYLFTKITKIKLIILVDSFLKSMTDIHYYDYLFEFLKKLGLLHYEKLILNLCLFYCSTQLFRTFMRNLNLILVLVIIIIFKKRP